MTKNLKRLITLFLIISIFTVGCGQTQSESASEETKDTNKEITEEEPILNLYTDRHYDTDASLYERFEELTGIKVNVVKAKSDELIERLENEGEDTEADLLITADAGRLFRAKDKGLLQPIDNEKIFGAVPKNLRDLDNTWIGLTMRARVLVYDKERVSKDDLSTYEALTNPEWEHKVLVRSSSNIYNQSLLASFIAINGEEAAKEWAKGLVENMARVPSGNDRDQAKAVVAGEGDVAIMNTYYLGKLLNSSEPEEVKVGQQVDVFFPNQETTGTHINVSGIGVTSHASHINNAILLIEFLTSEEAQGIFSEANYEYPVNPNVEPSELLKSWGDFKAQDINLTVLGENNQRAVQIFNEVGWQ